MKKAALILNGQRPHKKLLQSIDCDIILCADGAYDKIKNIITPDIILGDFDSIDKASQIPQNIKQISFSPEKDFTDGHLCLEYLHQNKVDSVDIYGFCGQRTDHFLANISLLKLAQTLNLKAKLIDQYGTIRLLPRGDYTFEAEIGTTVSLVPFTDTTHILSTTGLKYKIADKILDKVHILGISNIAVEGQIGLSIADGELLLIFVLEN